MLVKTHKYMFNEDTVGIEESTTEINSMLSKQ